MNLYRLATTSLNDIHVYFCLSVFHVTQIQQNLRPQHSHRNRRYEIPKRQALYPAHFPQRESKRNAGTGDRGRTSTAIGLQHIAVQKDGLRPKRRKIGHCSQGSPDESLDFVRSPAELSSVCFALIP
jgi:hypothetical protein